VALEGQLRKIITDGNYANRLLSVTGREYIFQNNDKVSQARLLYNEVEKINRDIPNLSFL
jgi:hypothetical protein